MSAVRVNGRDYRLPDGKQAYVAICLDGADPQYFEHAFAAGTMPELARWKSEATYVVGEAAFPTFTNPNNVSIVTGVSPAEHGIAGNHFYDPERREDVAMNERRYIRTPTVLEALSKAGARVLAVTAKDKLTKMIHPGAPGAAYSAESKGLDVYSAEASLFVLDEGIRAIERGELDFGYLSTTDYIQHKHAPGSGEADDFYAEIDARLKRFGALGAYVALTADHGMNSKTRADGSPDVVYLSDHLPREARVTLPITDPYVVHHGALGGCAMVYLSEGIERAREVLSVLPGVEAVLEREEAARSLELPRDRIGDLVVLAGPTAVLGKSAREHDLTHVAHGLRSHGSLHEARVPIALNRRVQLSARPRNRDLFHLLLNG
jgi:phosphonoacetate hydrolase